MAFNSAITPFLFPDNSGPSLSCNDAVQLRAGTGLSTAYTGLGGTFTIGAIGNLAALSSVSGFGLYTITGNGSSQTATLSSDGSIAITNPTGVLNQPIGFSVEPEFTVQLTNHYLNSSSSVSATEPGINWVAGDNIGITIIDNPGSKYATVEISATGGGGGGTVTNIATGTGLTGGPITTTGTISLANTAVTAGFYTAANITVNAQGQITAASNGSGGGAVSSVASSNNNQILASPTTGNVLLSLPSTLIAPGTFSAVTSVATPILNITGAFNNPWTTQPVSNGQVLSCSTSGVFAWIDNGSGGGAGITSNVLYCNAGIIPTLQTQVNLAISSSTSGNIYTVVVSPGLFPASTTALNITGASNGVGVQGFVNSGSSEPSLFGNSNINGDLNITSSSSLILNDVNVEGNTTLSTSLSGVNYFNNMTFAGTIEVQASGANITFNNCTFLSSVTVDSGYTGNLLFISCNFSNIVSVFNQASAASVIIQRCFGLNALPSHATLSGLNTLYSSPYNTILNEPIINIPGTGTYALPTIQPTSGQVIQATSPTTSTWATPSGGIATINGTANEITAMTAGSVVTLSIPSSFIAPGTLQATTSVTTPVLSMAGSGYTYILPVTTGSAPSNGEFLQYQSAGGGQCVWAAGGGGGAVSSVAAAGSNSTGLVVTPTTGNVTIGWDATQNAAFPKSASFNGTSGDPLTQFILPINEGAPGYFITYPDSGTQTYWSANYVTQVLGTANQINASTPSAGVVTLSFPGSQIFPGSLQTTGTVTASLGFDILSTTPLTFWQGALPTAPGGLLTSSTSGSLSWTNFTPLPAPSTLTLAFFFGTGTNFATANVTFSLAANGESVNIRIPLNDFQAFVCDQTNLECTSNMSIPSGLVPASMIDFISVGSIPIYDVTSSLLYYGQCYIKYTGSDYRIVFSLGYETLTAATPYKFTNTHTYSFGTDHNISGSANLYASFSYPINIV